MTSGGWNGRNYCRISRWDTVEHDLHEGFSINMGTVGGTLSGGWAGQTAKYLALRWRMRVPTGPTQAGGGSNDIKFFIFGGPGLAQGLDRMILHFFAGGEEGESGSPAPGNGPGNDDDHLLISPASGISADAATYLATTGSTVADWEHWQITWKYGNDSTLGGPAFIKIYRNNNTLASPNASRTVFAGAGNVWDFPDIVAESYWCGAVSSNSFTDRDAFFDVMDMELALGDTESDAFDASWAP